MTIVRLFACTALVLALAACATPEFKVMEADRCPVPAAKLTEQCALPQSLQTGATYDDLVVLAVQDNLSLRECSEQARFLRQAIEACNTSIDQHNERIRAINAKARAAH